MNIKPSGQQVEKWIAEASSEGGKILDPNKLAGLAATWGASQAQQTAADAARVLEWMRTPNRKPANLAFTDGPERQAAYWIEIAQQRVAQQTTEEPELPDAVARHNGGGFEWIADWLPTSDLNYYTAAQMHDHFQAGVRAGAAGWRGIDSAPKDGTKILAYTNDGYKYPLVCQCVFGEGEWWPDVWESPDEPLSPTHWMPSPPTPPTPPKKRKQ